MTRFSLFSQDISLKELAYTIYIKLFTSLCFQAIISLLFILVIEIISNTSQSNDKWLKYILITSVIYLCLQFFIINANRIYKRGNKFTVLIKDSLDGQAMINSVMSNKYFKLSKKIDNEIKHYTRMEANLLDELVSFQRVAFQVCDDICNIIFENLNCERYQVTVFQLFCEDNGKCYIKMIAYKNNEKTIPASYKEKYYLNDGKKEKTKSLILKIFEKNETETIILENKEIVKKNFRFFTGSKSREESIHQYVGVPVRSNTGNVTFVLQVDVGEKNAIGKNYNEIQQFANNILSPYCMLLHTYYEQYHALQNFYNLYMICNKEGKINEKQKEEQSNKK